MSFDFFIAINFNLFNTNFSNKKFFFNLSVQKFLVLKVFTLEYDIKNY